jgi:hypothetical protein
MKAGILKEMHSGPYLVAIYPKCAFCGYDLQLLRWRENASWEHLAFHNFLGRLPRLRTFGARLNDSGFALGPPSRKILDTALSFRYITLHGGHHFLNVTQMLRATFAYDVHHSPRNHANVAHTCRAKQEMYLCYITPDLCLATSWLHDLISVCATCILKKRSEKRYECIKISPPLLYYSNTISILV